MSGSRRKHRSPISRKRRLRVLDRDGWRCCYCSVERCEEREEPNNQYHCIFVVCAEGLKECRGDG